MEDHMDFNTPIKEPRSKHFHNNYFTVYSRKLNRVVQFFKKNKIEILCEEYPGLEDFIKGNYFGDKKYTQEKNMKLKILHKKFIGYCKALAYPITISPFPQQMKVTKL